MVSAQNTMPDMQTDRHTRHKHRSHHDLGRRPFVAFSVSHLHVHLIRYHWGLAPTVPGSAPCSPSSPLTLTGLNLTSLRVGLDIVHCQMEQLEGLRAGWAYIECYITNEEGERVGRPP